MQSSLVAVEGLSKRFADVVAVDDVSFQIHHGEVFGLLGPNGAGKSTTINLLTGLARPDAGTISIAGVDISRQAKAAQHLIGVIPDESNLYPELSGRENLLFCGALYGLRRRQRRSRADELLTQFGLRQDAERKFSTYSKGMKRQLTIAAGIIHCPQVLFMDEPTTGIDVASSRHIRRLVSAMNQSGTTILLTTHYIEEAERLCKRIAFIVSGRIVRLDTLASLLQPMEGRHTVEVRLQDSTHTSADELRASIPQLSCEVPEPGTLRCTSTERIRLSSLVQLLEEEGLEVLEARTVRPSLEEVFVAVTGIESAAMHAGPAEKG